MMSPGKTFLVIAIGVLCLSSRSVQGEEAHGWSAFSNFFRQPEKSRPEPDDNYLSLKEFVDSAFPELRLLLPQSSSTHTMIKSLSDIIKAVENPNPNSMSELSKAVATLSGMKPKTLEEFARSTSRSAQSQALMQELIASKKLSVQALVSKLKDDGKLSQSQKLAGYYALMEKLGKQKIEAGAVISKSSIENIRKLIPKMQKDLAPLVLKHKKAFLNNDKKGKEAFFKDLGKEIMEWDKKNGGVLSKSLDPGHSKDLAKVLKKAQKEAGIPELKTRLFLPEKEMEKLYSTILTEMTTPLIADIRAKAREEALRGVASKRMPRRIRAGATVGAPEGAIEGALDGALGNPRKGHRATGRVHLLVGRRKNYGYGENRGWNEAYDQAYEMAAERRRNDHQELYAGVKKTMEAVVNKNFEGMGEMTVHYLKDDGREDFSYLAFYDKNKTYASFRLGILDQSLKPDKDGKTLVEKFFESVDRVAKVSR